MAPPAGMRWAASRAIPIFRLSDEGLAKMRGLLPPPALRRLALSASPLLRARQTAEALGLADPILDARLMEQNWGRWEGLSRAEILARMAKTPSRRPGLKLQLSAAGRRIHRRTA